MYKIVINSDMYLINRKMTTAINASNTITATTIPAISPASPPPLVGAVWGPAVLFISVPCVVLGFAFGSWFGTSGAGDGVGVAVGNDVVVVPGAVF